MTHPLRIRPADAADLEQIVRVQVAAMVASEYYDDSDLDSSFDRLKPRIVGYFNRTYHPGFAEAARTIIVADCGEIVGFAAGHASSRLGCNAELQWMFVPPARQRQGIGSALLAALARWFERIGRTHVIVDCPPANPSRAFYLNHGALPLDAHWLHWPHIAQAEAAR